MDISTHAALNTRLETVVKDSCSQQSAISRMRTVISDSSRVVCSSAGCQANFEKYATAADDEIENHLNNP